MEQGETDGRNISPRDARSPVNSDLGAAEEADGSILRASDLRARDRAFARLPGADGPADEAVVWQGDHRKSLFFE